MGALSAAVLVFAVIVVGIVGAFLMGVGAVNREAERRQA